MLNQDIRMSFKGQKKQEVIHMVKNIRQLPDDDSAETVKQLISYLNQLLRIKVIVPPISEIMILLQNEKPKLYHGTRYAITSTSNLQILFQIMGDAHLAEQRLRTMIEGAEK